MTETTQVLVPVAESSRSSARFRFGVAFLAGLIAATALGAGALYAYDRQYEGRIIPGVWVGDTDLSGLTPEAAAERLNTAYASLAAGTVVVQGPDGDVPIAFADIGRGPDVDTMIAEAMSVGRGGNAAERAIAGARTAVNGVILEPRVQFDAAALATKVDVLARSIAKRPSEASVAIEEAAFKLVPGAIGREADPVPATTAILEALGSLDAPAEVTVPLPVADVEPAVTTEEALAAKSAAERVTAPIVLQVGKDDFTIKESTLRSWVSFAPTVGGDYRPVLDTTELRKLLKSMAKKIDRKAVNATYTTSGSRISGIVPSRDGRKLDYEATVLQVQRLLLERFEGSKTTTLDPKVKVTEPALTTAEAKAARPKMRKISSWTTYFPIGEKNGYGANIWLPALAIDGYVVAPRAKFDFWQAVGTISRAKGYRQGGAIIDGRTEPQGALAGGICSCSTTLFNAALRAGYKMGARRNHFYYIDRYPLGLDATVFISGSGSKQTMSFTNDTDYPILIRGYKIKDGGSGYVRFVLYSVPNGRRVSFSKPIVRNVRPASDTVQYTSSLRPGSAQRVEYPVDGKQVWVTRTVRNRSGKLIHRETYYSNYARITGLTLIGRASADR
jgi:vancomycin resistance protein YoaR